MDNLGFGTGFNSFQDKNIREGTAADLINKTEILNEIQRLENELRNIEQQIKKEEYARKGSEFIGKQMGTFIAKVPVVKQIGKQIGGYVGEKSYDLYDDKISSGISLNELESEKVNIQRNIAQLKRKL